MEQWKQVTMEYSPEFFEQQFEESLAVAHDSEGPVRHHFFSWFELLS
jgi:hypothetical protein